MKALMNHSRRGIICLTLLLAVVCVSACGDDDAAGPDFTFEPVLSALWPRADGTTWNFTAREVERDTTDEPGAASVEDLPPLPSFADLYSSLYGAQGEGTVRSGSMTLQFDGAYEYSPGLQWLRITPTGGLEHPIPFRNDQALWKLEDDRIVGYQFGVGNPVWIYLTSDLARGDGFVEYVFDQFITLEGRVWRHLQLPWGGRDVDCVEIVYLLDQGVTVLERTAGSDPEHFRAYTYGAVVYGEGVGPMSWRERTVQPPSSVTQDLGYIEPGKLIDSRITLESVDFPAEGNGSAMR